MSLRKKIKIDEEEEINEEKLSDYDPNEDLKT